MKEGSLEAPTRHPLNWEDGEFYEEEPLHRKWSEFSTFVTDVGGALVCVPLFRPFLISSTRVQLWR
jgi:hypothetical protein